MIASSTLQAATARKNFLGEVHARLDRVHIDEDLALAETIGQAVIQPASKMAGFLPTVADKDATALSYGHVKSRYRRGIWTEMCRFTCGCEWDG
jgi:hypothetical protein